MRRRFMAVLAGAVLVLTLLFSVLAGAVEALQAQERQYEDTPALENTAQDTTTDDIIDQAAQEAQEGNADRSNSDSFQCVSFLRVVRNDQGALRVQYRDDDLIVQRFEQCLEGEVLADTIPDEDLPYTGGVPLLGLAAIGLASMVAGASVLRAATRRRR